MTDKPKQRSALREYLDANADILTVALGIMEHAITLTHNGVIRDMADDAIAGLRWFVETEKNTTNR